MNEKAKQNKVRMILKPHLPETILFDFDWDLRKMNVNEVRKNELKTKNSIMCICKEK